MYSLTHYRKLFLNTGLYNPWMMNLKPISLFIPRYCMFLILLEMIMFFKFQMSSVHCQSSENIVNFHILISYSEPLQPYLLYILKQILQCVTLQRQIIMSPMSKTVLFPSFQLVCFLFSCLIALAQASSVMLNKSSERRHGYFVHFHSI